MHFCERLKYARDEEGLSQDFVASQLGMSQSNYSKSERGTQKFQSDLVEKVIENYTTVLGCLIEEMQEAIESAKAIKKIKRNKKACEYFSVSEQDDIYIRSENIEGGKKEPVEDLE